MKNRILSLALILFASTAHAEWVKVFENIRGTTVYVNTDGLISSGRFRKSWELENYKKAAENGMLSMKMRKEYDCEDEMMKLEYFVAYKGLMGTGTELGTVRTPAEWQPISKNPGGKGAFRLVCNK
jgi:hypothetical protein